MLVAAALLHAPESADAAELLIFEQKACPFCAAFNKEIAPDYPQSRAGRLAPLRHVDIWESRTGGIEDLDPAVFTPTFVLVEDGQEVGRLMGYPGRRYFYAEIDELIDKLPQIPVPRRPMTSPPARAARPCGRRAVFVQAFTWLARRFRRSFSDRR